MEIIGIIAGILTLVGYLPQTLKTIVTRKTKDLSLPTFIIIGSSASLWVVYGLDNDMPSIWFTNSIVALCSIIITVIKIKNKD